jgi:hypothetical protein
LLPGRDERRSFGFWLPRRGRDPSLDTALNPTGDGGINSEFVAADRTGPKTN